MQCNVSFCLEQSISIDRMWLFYRIVFVMIIMLHITGHLYLQHQWHTADIEIECHM